MCIKALGDTEMKRRFICLCTAAVIPAVFAQSPGTFTPTGSMISPRYGHTATLLLNGKVLLAGGRDANASTLVSAEIYDPETGTFGPTGQFTVNPGCRQRLCSQTAKHWSA